MPINGPPAAAPVDLAALLQKGLDRDPDGVALRSLAASWTWRQLDQASARWARHMLAMGLKPGDRVASLMPNRVELVVHYVACLRAGLVITPLNYEYVAAEIDHAIALSGAKLVLAHGERAEAVRASQEIPKLPLGLVSYGVADGAPALEGCPSFEQLLAQEAPELALVEAAPEAPAVILFTSGSTGRPKGVTHSRRGLAWTFGAFASHLIIDGEDRLFPAVSLSHGGGVKLTLTSLAMGACVGVARRRDPAQLLELLRQLRPTVMTTLPSILYALVHDHGATAADFAGLRSLITAGDKLSNQLRDDVAALSGLSVCEGYGLTETGGVLIMPPSGGSKAGSLGHVVAGVSLSLRDDGGAEVPQGREGRLWIKSPGTMTGYWENPAETAKAFRDGWFDSGDIMRVDADGDFWFCGRAKQIIVHNGLNIYPQEVEGALEAHPAVALAGVVGVDDPHFGQDVFAFVTLDPDRPPPGPSALIDFARARVGYKAPEKIIVLDKMPFNPTGKIDRKALRELAAQR